jgi:Tol biopolymer transport system component
MTTFLLATLLLAPATAHAQSAADLFQRALRAERVEGELEEAIRLYGRVVELGDRTLAARALLNMGESYERLGREGAEEAYRRLVSEFADQEAEADAARSRLAAITRVAGDPSAVGADRAGVDRLSLRLVWPDGPWAPGRPTPDGRGVTYADHGPDHGFALAVRTLGTSESRVLKHEGGGTYPINSSVSNDGDQVAFQWIPGPWQPQLRVIGMDGTGERILVENATVEIDYIVPFEWMPGDREILVSVQWMDGHRSIGLVSVADGTMRTLRSFTPPETPAQNLALSPDGRWVAYDVPDQRTRTADIVVLATDGSAERKLISHPASDLRPTWSPDGRHLLFVSDRGGSVDLWASRVTDGDAHGDAFLVQREIGVWSIPMGFTDDGSLFFFRWAGGGDIFAAELEDGRVVGEPERVVPVYQGYNNGPSWSQDGRRMVYVSRRSPTVVGNAANLVVRDEATGQEFEPAPAVLPHRGASHPRISPDGNLVALKTWSLDGPSGMALRLVDLRDGSVRTLEEPGPSGPCSFCPVVFSNDGAAVFYSTEIPTQPLESPEDCPLSDSGCVEYRGLIRHDLATGSRDRVFAWDFPARRSWGLSPDQTRIVTLEPADTADDATLVRIGALGTGTREEIARIRHDVLGCQPDHDPLQPPVWTEADRILFVCRRPAEPGGTRMGQMRMSELMSLPVAGGEPRSTGLVMEELRQLSVRPDGRIGFAAGPRMKREIWVLSGLAGELERTASR